MCCGHLGGKRSWVSGDVRCINAMHTASACSLEVTVPDSEGGEKCVCLSESFAGNIGRVTSTSRGLATGRLDARARGWTASGESARCKLIRFRRSRRSNPRWLRDISPQWPLNALFISPPTTMLGIIVDTASTIPRLGVLLILSLPLFVAAQNSVNPFDNGSGTPGAVVAGVVVGAYPQQHRPDPV